MSTFATVTGIYAGVGLVGLILAQCCGQYKALARLLAVIFAFCTWLSWATVYMAQMNPLIVPELSLLAE